MSSPKDDLAHLKIPFETILSATNNFDEENLFITNEFGKSYKGQLLWSGELINIFAQRFNKERDEEDEQEFWTELSMLTSLEHKNLVSIVGFCDEKDEKVIITKYDETRGLLNDYLSDPMLLTWVQRLKISVGLAHALSYIHYDEPRDFSVIHRYIESGRVLLNDEWEPKLCDFQHSMKIKASQRHHSFHTNKLEGVNGYVDPTYIETKRAHHKSDIYSFGIVLFELLCGRRSVSDDQDKKYLGPVAITHFREERLNEIIDWDLYKQMDSQSFEIFAKIAYDCLNEERSKRPNINEIAPRLEEALKIARVNSHIMSSPKDDLAHLKIPLESILSATNNFDDKNVIITGDFGKSYKGQLLWSGELININARRMNKERKQAEQEFWTEISMLSSLKHKNVVSLVGFCDEKDEKVIITKYDETRGLLSDYLSDPMRLTWVQRLKISVGLAHALSYIHYDDRRDFSVIHRYIDSSRVLLNDDWEPKLCDFNRSMKIKASQRNHSFHTNTSFYVIGYGDPTYIETKKVNHKSDIYSFGIVLFELLCGRRSVSDDQDKKYLGPVAITHFREEKLNEIIDWDLCKQMDSQSFEIFAKIAYDCLNEEMSQRPNINEIAPRLEEALKIARVNSHIMPSPKDDLAHLKIPLESILSATNNFDDKNIFIRGVFEKRYKGQLLWSGELINIIARRINKERKQAEQEFWMEISMLTSLKHKNVVSLVGFCDENDEKIILYQLETRSSLSNYLSDPILLTWVRRLEISVGLANALSYIHYDEPRDFSIIHRNIDSDAVLLNDNWEPKLSGFELSMTVTASERHLSFDTDEVWSTDGYTDPTYLETKSAHHKSDIYSFGIVLFELLCGRRSVIYDQDNKYLAPMAIFHYKEKILDDIIDPDLWKQMDPQSFDNFAKTAYECLNEEQSQRPNMDQIVTRLEKALELQLKRENILMLKEHSIVKDPLSFIHRKFQHLKIELEAIKSATNGFDDSHCIGKGGFGKVYKGELVHSKGQSVVALKRLDRAFGQGDPEFWKEIIMLSLYRHDNIVSLLGFCDDCGEKILVYEYASKKSLDLYLNDEDLTWVQRLEICIGAARGLAYLHNPGESQQRVLHRDIKSANILLDENWNARIADLGLSKFGPANQQYTFLVSHGVGTIGYCDPLYVETGLLTKESDVYSFGVVLFEMLCGRLCISNNHDKRQPLTGLVRKCCEQETIADIVYGNIKDEINPRSLKAFTTIAYQCTMKEPEQRPLMTKVVNVLESALKLQGPVSSKLSAGLKLSAKDILSSTNNFSRENFINNFRFGRIYKGRIMHSGQFIDIIAKVFSSENEIDISKAFWTEISMLSSLKHKNIVSVIGFSDNGVKSKVFIYKKEDNESLKNHLSDQTLTWMQRLKICVAVAKTLSYIHYDAGRDFSIIHCNIESSNILLDSKWEPKLSGFELSLKNLVARRHRLLLTRDIVKNVYLDPKYEKTGGVTHKSDVYSFGVVLFEVLCGRSAVDEDELGEGLLSQLAQSHLDDMIDPHLRKQMDPEAFKIFSETAYYCIQVERTKRPYIDQVVSRLEKALQLQWKRENPVDSTSSNRLKEKNNLEHLKIGLDVINEATKNFDDSYCIGSRRFSKVYQAYLEHFDSSNSSSIEGVNKCDLPRKRSTVAIKRMHDQEGEQGFIAEIETLITCKHENVISLLGFCYEGNGAMILVYEHASKGSLEDYLGSSDKMTNLSWLQRLNICLDIAHGLNYIHNNTDYGKQKMIHRDIKSDNILLGDNWKAKIAEFGLSKFYPADQEASTIYTNIIAGTYPYLDPEYEKTGKLHKKSDIYSFGVVLLEVLSGRLAYDSVYTKVNDKGIAPVARDHFEKGTLMEIVDHNIKQETNEHVFSLSKGPSKESLDIFLEIAFQCVVETQAQRPTIEVVINQLKKALDYQENHKDNLKLSLEEIKLATKGFSQDNIIGHGDSGNVYKGATHSTHGDNIFAVKRLDKKSGQGDAEVLTEVVEAKFMAELDILMEYKHSNVIGLVGYCDEEDEKIIVYDYASRGSLDNYLSDDSLTWVMRLKICIDIAIGLEFLHGTSPEMVIHRDISSSNILLFDDWKAKLTDFGLSLVLPTNQNVDYVIDNVTGTIGYCDPLHSKTGFLTKESDIFSLGAVLFDILCGKQSSEEIDDEYLYLPFLAKYHYHVGKLDKLVFEGIKEQIVPQSYTTFTRIALQCLHHRRERRPTAGEVIIQLKKALEFQENSEIWELKLPKDYKEIIQMSKCPEDYSTIKKEDLYNIFSRGILLQQDKVLLSFIGNGERNEMVTATMFSYINSYPHDRISLPESRFGAVVEILDIFNLKIEIKTRAQFLSPNVVYGVYLVFKFCDSRNCSSKPMYVNLKYRKGHESLHSYFATWRDEQWMMIELHRFSNQNEHAIFEFLLESFSTYYCGDGAIYVEGIEFRAIGKVKHDDIGKLKEVPRVLKSNFIFDQVKQLPIKFKRIFTYTNYDKLFWLGKVNGKKLLMISAKTALQNSSNVNLFSSIPSAHSRFRNVIELLPQQVFHINCTIKSQMLSPDTEYVCYLVFKLSEECEGLHNPVKVRDLLHQVYEEAEFFYFITPSPLNINDITRVPKQREDGWMEIQLWKLNSTHDFKDDSLSINMRFANMEGIMSGLIVCGLEFRPAVKVELAGLQLISGFFMD